MDLESQIAYEIDEWADGLWTMDEVTEALPSFGVELRRNSVRNLFVELGIKPAFYFTSRETQRGRVGYYDPLVAWVVATVQYSPERGMTVLRGRVDAARGQAALAVWGEDLAAAPDLRDPYDDAVWGWRVESTAYHLFITDVRHGLEPRRIHAIVSAQPAVLSATMDSNSFFEAELRGYISRYVASSTGAVLDPSKINLLQDGRPPLFTRRIKSSSPIELLDSLGYLKPNGRNWPGPAHVTDEWHTPEQN